MVMDIKKILIVIILFFSNAYGYAQKYKITYTAFAQAEPCDPDPIRNSYDRILLENTNTNKSFVLALGNCSKLIDEKVNFVAYVNFLPNAISEKLYAENTRGDVVVDEYQRVPVNFNHCDSKTTLLTRFNNTIKVAIEPYTEINPQPVNNALCKITLNVDVKGFAPEVYKWQYYDVLSTATDKWTDFPNSFQGVDTITFDLEELFGNKASLYYQKSIQYRMQRYCSGKTTKKVTYVMVGCSPELKEPVENKETTCNYSNDGSFTLNFKRDLYTSKKETLVMTLYDGNDETTLFNQEFTRTLVDNGDGTYSYTWKKPLDAGTYRIKFQTHNKEEGINTSDLSWKSLEFSEKFTIGKPKKVLFSIAKTSDETCFEIYDGYIEVSATGETGRTFLYQLTKNGVVQIVGGKSWFPFTNGSSTEISSLGKGTYRVKVKDSKGCFARKN